MATKNDLKRSLT